jgi:hypothetical protein
MVIEYNQTVILFTGTGSAGTTLKTGQQDCQLWSIKINNLKHLGMKHNLNGFVQFRNF